MSLRSPNSPKAIRWAVPAVVGTAILATSILPPPEVGAPTSLLLGVSLDKWLHATAYACLTVALAAASRATGRPLLVVAAVAVAYGAGIEGIQSTLPYRTCSALDAAANAVGAGVGVAAWQALVRSRE